MTAIGAASVFAFRGMNKKMMDGTLGFAAGIMIAVSFFSLLLPSIEMAEAMGLSKWFTPLVGFILGGVSLRIIDMILPHIHHNALGTGAEPEGLRTTWRRSTLLILALTLHNIPEGLAIGVAFGSVVYGIHGATLAGAIALAVGIGIQDLPEGFSVSMPLRTMGWPFGKSFFYGMLSGLVEPIGAVIGALTVMSINSLLPYALSFTAGAMIFVTMEELIPQAEGGGNEHIATFGIMFGFALMMVLEIVFALHVNT